MEATNPESESNFSESNSKRLLSLDALRGFNMFWIIGGAQLISSIAEATQWSWADYVQAQLTHAEWHGFLAYDLIFPLFMFIAGVSVPYALLSKLEKAVPISKLALKIIRRTGVLILFGIIYNGVLQDFRNPRLASVLGQIGVSYGIAALLCLYCRKIKYIAISGLLIMVSVSLAQLCFPVAAGQSAFMPETTVNAFLDQRLLPGQLYGEHYDPEGVLNMVSGSVIVLMGTLTGFLLRRKNLSGYRKTGITAGAGLCMLLVAQVADQWYPINKQIWTSTFNVYAGGLSLLLMAAFYLLIDVLKFAKWSFPFQVIGMNAITIYMLARLFNFQYISQVLLGGVASQLGAFEMPILDIGMLLIEWLLLFYLYKKRIFLKV